MKDLLVVRREVVHTTLIQGTLKINMPKLAGHCCSATRVKDHMAWRHVHLHHSLPVLLLSWSYRLEEETFLPEGELPKWQESSKVAEKPLGAPIKLSKSFAKLEKPLIERVKLNQDQHV